MTGRGRRTRILAVTAAAAAATLLGGTALVAGSVGAAVPPSTAHGANFLLKSALDTNFCIDVAPGNTEGRSLSLSACSTADTERWALTENDDGTNALVDSQGMCVDITGRKVGDGIGVAVSNCRFGRRERFRYTSSGHILAKGNACLSVQVAGTGAPVALQTCNATSAHQVFQLAH